MLIATRFLSALSRFPIPAILFASPVCTLPVLTAQFHRFFESMSMVYTTPNKNFVMPF